MDAILIIFLSGVTVGSLYSLMALSYYLVSSATGIINFAQGELAMLAAVAAVALLSLGVPYPLAILLGLVSALGVSICSFLGIIVPLDRRGASLDTMIVALLGLSIVVRYGTGWGLGRSDRSLAGPIEGTALTLPSGFQISAQDASIWMVTAAAFVATWFLLQTTWTGRSYRVAAINPKGAQICGINLRWVQLLAFTSGAFVAALAGWLYAPLYAANYLIGGALGLKGFICMVIGGTSTPFGPLVGGMLIGLLEVFAAYYIGSLYSEGIAFIILLLFLAVRPGGVVGSQ